MPNPSLRGQCRIALLCATSFGLLAKTEKRLRQLCPSDNVFKLDVRLLSRVHPKAAVRAEHLRLVVGKDSIADALLRHFGSLKALSRASFKELRQFLPKGKAEAVMAALSISNVADAEHALSAPLNSAEAIYRANLDMKGFHQEVVRVVLLDAQNRCITRADIARGTVNESLAAPREIFRPAIIHSAFAFVLAHNHPSGEAKPSEADLQLTKRIATAAQILQINFLDHVIVGQGYFSFQEAGLLQILVKTKLVGSPIARSPIAVPLDGLTTCSTKSLIDVFAAGVFRAAFPPPGLPRPADGSCVAP